MDTTPLVPAGTSAGGLHGSYIACYISFPFCFVFLSVTGKSPKLLI